ncbi:MAG: hypothetical protein Q7S00_02755 [bacterium]|nr:hypothetical protein [bacterium]
MYTQTPKKSTPGRMIKIMSEVLRTLLTTLNQIRPLTAEEGGQEIKMTTPPIPKP